MARLLARMERDGLVRRAAAAADRRSSLVSLTDDARARIPAGRAILQRGNAEMMQGLSAEEAETLLGLLRRVLANVEVMDGRAQGD